MHVRSGEASAPKSSLSSGAYILLSFPLGMLYFLFIVAGLSLSIALIPIFIGLPMLVGVLAGADGIAGFERSLAKSVLGRQDEPPPAPRRHPPGAGFFRRLFNALSDPASYLNVILCLLKFPIGTVNFAVSTALMCASLALVAAPAFYVAIERTLGVDIFADPQWLGIMGLANLAPQLTPLQMSFVLTAVGVVLLLISISLIRALARMTANITLAIA